MESYGSVLLAIEKDGKRWLEKSRAQTSVLREQKRREEIACSNLSPGLST